MPSVPGCIKHYAKLAAAISEARTRHKSLCVCWLDLANAYGSVHQDLIKFSIEFYRAPTKPISMVGNFYSSLSASISIPEGRTRAIPLKIGLYQGDPLSVTIFNTVMNTYLDVLKHLQQCVYTPHHPFMFSSTQMTHASPQMGQPPAKQCSTTLTSGCNGHK